MMLALALALGSETLTAQIQEPPPPALVWKALPDLPNAIGYGGPFVMTLDRGGEQVLVVAGGANFPEAPPWEGGEKRWHADTWIYDGAAWEAGPPLPEPRAYGAVAHVGGAAWMIAGGDANSTTGDVWIASFGADGALRFDEGPALPEPVEFLSAAVVGDVIVAVGGGAKRDGEFVPVGDQPPTWTIRPEVGARWAPAAPFPGVADYKLVACPQKTAAGEPALFVASGEVHGATPPEGGSAIPMSTELWSYEPGRDRWTKRNGLGQSIPSLDGTGSGISAGVAWPIGTLHIAFFSGVSMVPARVPQAERAEFVAEARLYHTITDRWSPYPESMPRGVVTTGIAPWQDGFVIASGEVRPGVRTPQVQFGTVQRSPAPLATVDYAVMIAYLLALVALGVFFARRERTAEDFFLAGHRIPWWAAGLSIYATQLSAITYVSIPAKAFVDDWVFALTSLTILAMAPIVVVFYLPFFRRLEIKTAYEYLERRFSLPIRLFGSASFMAFQLARMAIVVFLPSLALSTVTGVDIYLCIAAIGLLSTAYTVLGGFEAVVWTDVLQVFVLIGGLVVALVLAIDGAGGLGEAIEVAKTSDKLRWFAPGTSWTDTASWSVLLGAMFLQFGPYTTDQAVVQRYLSTKDERSAARGIWLNGIIAVPATFAFFALGSALFAYFSAAPEALAPGMQNDEVFPLFIALEMPAGLAGLVLAGIFAASMSSLDSSMHAIATAWTNDWHTRLGIGKADELTVGRRVTLLMGLVGTGAASAMAALELRSLYDTFQSVLGLLISPLAGLFFLGIFTRRTSATAAGIGAVAAIAALAWVQNRTPLNFMLYGAVGTSTCVVTGYLVSFVLPNHKEQHAVTWWSRESPTAVGD